MNDIIEQHELKLLNEITRLNQLIKEKDTLIETQKDLIRVYKLLNDKLSTKKISLIEKIKVFLKWKLKY